MNRSIEFGYRGGTSVRAVTAALPLLALLLSPAASANFVGINNYSGNPATEGGLICSLCHTGGSAPLVTLAGPSVVQGCFFLISVGTSEALAGRSRTWPMLAITV